MLFLKHIRNRLLRRKPPKQVNPDIPHHLEDDVGVRVTRIRLPSGKELVILEWVKDEE